jgi:branched-chain amino acid transport system ATP-binding protein
VSAGGAIDLMLECSGLSKSYSGVTAIREASISFRIGDITAIVGANGAGKTTLLDMLSGHIFPDTGSIRIAGMDVTRMAAYRRARRGMLRGFQDAALFPDLTVEETLFLSGFRSHRYTVASAILRAPKARRNDRDVRNRARQVAASFNLDKWLRTPIKDLSLGMTKIVQFAAVSVARPSWILLDEPAAGLARAEVDKLAGVIRRLSADIPDCGIILVEHDAILVAETADRVIVMGDGTVVDDLRRDDPGWTHLLSARTGSDEEALMAAETIAKDAAVSQSASITPPSSDRSIQGPDPIVDLAPISVVATADRPLAARPESVAEAPLVPSVCADRVTIRYGGFTAVRDVTIEIRQGEVCVLVGTNGAGKSSILNAIIGLKAPASGRITIDGRDVTSQAPHARLRDGLVMVPSGRGLLAGLTVAENLRVARTVKTAKASIDGPDPLELFPELRTRMRQRAGTLSGGQQQMLAIARSVQLNPRYLLIDELSLGLNPTVVDRLVEALLTLRQTGVGFLIVEQNAPLALSYSDRAYVMNQGVLAFDGPSSVAAQMPDLFRPVFLETPTE